MSTKLVEITAHTPDGTAVKLCIPAGDHVLRCTMSDGTRHVYIPGFTPPDYPIEMGGVTKTFRELWIEQGLDPLEVDFFPRSNPRRGD